MSRFYHSIRWRLQLWHGLLLVLVLAVLGFTAYRFERMNRMRRLDDQLQFRVAVVASALQRSGRPSRPPPDGPPPDRRVEDAPRGRFPPPPRNFRIPPGQADLFEASGIDAFYFVLWFRDGEEVSRSTTAPKEVPRPERDEGAHTMRMRGTARECFHYTPPGECILVGRDVTSDLAELRALAWGLAAAGGAVLALGLAGGWWLASHAIRPVHDISAAAARIASGDLSQRICTNDAASELGQLAAVLNSTFARLEAAFARQARFTSDAAHELRTPVTVMIMQTQGALARERPVAEYRETLSVCQRAAQRMRGLIESSLQLARLDAGHEPMKREHFDLAANVAECVEFIRPLATERGIMIHAELSPAECLGHSEHIGQVVVNLLTNAIHYNKDGGEIRLTTATQDALVILTVEDTGQGISAADLPHVFERFYRADKSRARANGRTGLGLAIVQSIIKAHDGAIEVASEVGKGTMFTVRLPASA